MEQWKMFVDSNDRETLLKCVDSDFQMIKMFFTELLKQTKTWIATELSANNYSKDVKD